MVFKPSFQENNWLQFYQWGLHPLLPTRSQMTTSSWKRLCKNKLNSFLHCIAIFATELPEKDKKGGSHYWNTVSSRLTVKFFGKGLEATFLTLKIKCNDNRWFYPLTWSPLPFISEENHEDWHKTKYWFSDSLKRLAWLLQSTSESEIFCR